MTWTNKTASARINDEGSGKGTAILIRAWTGPLGSRRSRLPELPDNQHMKVARLSALGSGRLYPPEHTSEWAPRAIVRPDVRINKQEITAVRSSVFNSEGTIFFERKICDFIHFTGPDIYLSLMRFSRRNNYV
jgi:hypothetical protein